ncbi:MAG: sigma-70 family RNA polymerase sigma factor [Bacteroidia bacterium]|nr:sigma-70 family RNA polymerase sigma factor [Bacteroidia bacterium]
MKTATRPEASLAPPGIDELYESAFPAVAAVASKWSASLEEVRDLFHDALILYYEKSQQADFFVASAEAYIVGIVKHLLIRKHKLQRNMLLTEQWEESIQIPDDFYPDVKTTRLMSLLEYTGERCLQLLKAFYYDGLSMQLIAQRFGYRTQHSATVQKFKCLERTRRCVEEKHLSHEDFFE